MYQVVRYSSGQRQLGTFDTFEQAMDFARKQAKAYQCNNTWVYGPDGTGTFVQP